MSYFTEVFHALDSDNKGYILFNDFKNKILTYFNNDDQTNLSDFDNEQHETITKFLALVREGNDEKIYFDQFIDAIKKLNESSNKAIRVVDVKDDDGESSQFQMLVNSECSPFINDGDSYSTGDSGLDNESKIAQEFTNNNIGKQNKKRIKDIRNLDLGRSGETIKKRHSQNLPCELDYTDFSGNMYQKSFSCIPNSDLKSSYHSDRRQSDFVTCASHRTNRRSHYEDDDESRSVNCWTPFSGSATDLFYHDSMTDIRQKLEKLEQSMDNLQMTSDDSKHSKQRWLEENQHLKTKIHKLEDTIRQQKRDFERNLSVENEASRKLLTKYQQSKSQEIEILNERLQVKDTEIDNLKKELNVVLGDCERIKYEKLRSEDKFGDLQLQMNFIEEDMKRMKEFHSRELELLAKERNRCLSETKDTIDCNDIQSKTNGSVNTLQADLTKLRTENQELKSKLKNCEEEFLAFSVQQGHNILQSVSMDNSWLMEIDGYTKLEVIDLLVKEKDANYRLREYVSGILTRIIERDPSLLEIT